VRTHLLHTPPPTRIGGRVHPLYADHPRVHTAGEHLGSPLPVHDHIQNVRANVVLLEGEGQGASQSVPELDVAEGIAQKNVRPSG